ncbi:GNAT family N-acetyltransferase [Oceanirhabdus sp. W0125-5]|uniref:GNAT family N-acetyltransferase n=1 Tax=Oceanirhabdus sp. W0125-5 TaxID=2999116 RepID=UPI0022F2FF87|nr:GNAT family N-acetyltransferase [Oceanirhabdus sp. W0125-5]WBW96435.1 GNAT family N-acetyltransferase [Oceanirhabdus sp. W0125-5]
MIIRKLKKEEYSQAIDLKINSFYEEVAGTAPNHMVKEDELNFILEWVISAEKYNDIRLVYGCFDNEKFMGFAGASIAEESDSNNGIELNYLFVKEEYRGKGISLKLLNKLLKEFLPKDFKELIVYNYNFYTSNQYYRKLGGKVKKQTSEMDGKLLIDIFSFDAKKLNEKLEKMIHDRY